MSDVRNKLIKYAVHFPVILAFITALYFLAVNARIWSLSLAFLFSYAFVYQGLLLIFDLMDRKKLAVITGGGITLVLIIMFRDMVLTENILIAFATFLLGLLLENSKISRYSWLVMGAAICVSSLLIYEVPKVAAVSIIMLLIYGLSKLVCQEAEYYMGVVLLVGIITLVIPAKEDPIEWSLVKKIISVADTGFDKSVDEISYFFDVVFNAGTSFAGYSDNARLRGKMTDSPSVELIMSGKSEAKMMYLEGGYYNGVDSGGLTDKEGMSSNYNYWFVEYINGLYQEGVDDRTAECFSSIKSSEIIYRYMRTADVIRPNNLLWIDTELKNGLSKKMGKGFRYNVRYMQVDYASPYLRDYVKSIKDTEIKYASFKEISDYVKEVYKVNLKDTIKEEEYNEAVNIISNDKWKDKYLDTSFASDRLKELTAQVTEGADSDFEKAKKIESFLRQYKYDKGIDLRGTENYVDEFLFVTQKGYCVHYASAMLLMLRSAGIPARYVNGFMHTVNETGSVMSSEAHAWPEAYIEGLGWVPFEPTGAYKTAEDYTWKLGLNYVKKTDESDEKSGKKADDIKEGNGDENYHKPDDELVEIPKPDISKKDKEDKIIDGSFIKKSAAYAALIIGALICVTVLFYLIRYNRYMHMTSEQKLMENMKRVFKILENTDKEKLEPKLKKDLEALIDSYRRVRFRGDAADEVSVRLSVKVYRMLKSWLKQENMIK